LGGGKDSDMIEQNAHRSPNLDAPGILVTLDQPVVDDQPFSSALRSGCAVGWL
jgi:hypothetical protein